MELESRFIQIELTIVEKATKTSGNMTKIKKKTTQMKPKKVAMKLCIQNKCKLCLKIEFYAFFICLTKRLRLVA